MTCCMGGGRNLSMFWLENLKEKGHFDMVGVVGKIILKSMLTEDFHGFVHIWWHFDFLADLFHKSIFTFSVPKSCMKIRRIKNQY